MEALSRQPTPGLPLKMAYNKQGAGNRGVLSTMKLFSERGTDEQYVEAIRTWLANPQGSWTRHMGACALLWAMGIALPLLIA